MIKPLATAVLTWSAKRVLQKQKPIIIAVTGSVGKTSTKEALALVLKTKLNVRATKKNLNTEVGVPLVVLGLENPEHSILGWIEALMKAILMATVMPEAEYPTHLLLEYGLDRPGDIKHLCELAPPTVGVVTAITHVHVSNFPSFDALIAEKAELVKALPSNGLAVLNTDDPIVRKMAKQTQAPVVYYGFGDDAEISASDVSLVTGLPSVMGFVVHDRAHGTSAPMQISDALGEHQVRDALAAIAVGRYFGIDLATAAAALAEYTPPPGRLKPLAGIKGTIILDDTYNAAPASTAAALEVLKAFYPADGGRRIAALGTMAELGSHTEEQHRHIGWKAAEVGVDLLLCAGEPARDIARGAREAGMPENQMVEVKDAEEAGRYLDKEIKTGDVILVKGSQSMRMERAVKDILAEPQRAGELLVRQSEDWLKR